MGEIADMMLSGDMCQWCGEMLSGDGYPTICAGCQGTEYDEHGNNLGEEPEFVGHKALPRKFMCPIDGCNRKLRTRAGIAQHVAMKHVKDPDDPKPNSPADLGFG